MEIVAKSRLLHQGFAHAHVGAALDLALDDARIERAPAIVRQDDAFDANLTGLKIDLYFGNARAVRIRRRRTDPRAFEVAMKIGGRRVRTNPRQRSEARLGSAGRVDERESAIGIFAIEDATVLKGAAFGCDAELRTGDDRDPLAHVEGGASRRVARHKRYATGIGAEIDRRQIGIAGANAHVEHIDAERFGNDDGKHILRSLTAVAGAAENGDAAAAIDLDDRAGVRHGVPVNRQPGTAEICTRRKPDPAAGSEFSMLVAKAGTFGDGA